MQMFRYAWYEHIWVTWTINIRVCIYGTVQTFGYALSADIWVCMECWHSGMRGMQTFGHAWNVIRVRIYGPMQTFGYTWNANIRVCVECRHSGMHGVCRHSGMRGMQIFGYAWNANSRVYVERKYSGTHGVCRHSGMKYSKYSLESCACFTLSKEFCLISSCLVFKKI